MALLVLTMITVLDVLILQFVLCDYFQYYVYNHHHSTTVVFFFFRGGGMPKILTSKPHMDARVLYIPKPTLPETNGLPLKIGHPKRKLVFQSSIFRCYVSFREGKYLEI